MKYFTRLSFLLSCFLVSFAYSQDTPIRYGFNNSTAAENGITLQGPGFGALPQTMLLTAQPMAKEW